MPTGRDDARSRGKAGSRRPTAEMKRLIQAELGPSRDVDLYALMKPI